MIELIITLILSFFIVLIVGNPLINFLKNAGIIGVDQQKKNKPVLPTSGGLIIAVSFVLSVFIFITLNTFLLKRELNLLEVFAVTSSVLVITFIGLMDDMAVEKKKIKNKGLKDYRKGLSQRLKPALTFFGAVPLMAVAVGTTTMNFPIIGAVNFGVLFPLVIVPLAVVFVSNAYNMYAGLNGLSEGLGIVIFMSSGIFSILNNEFEAALISFTVVGALIAYLKYGWYPARILVGDSMTYLLGALFVSVAVVGNIEKFSALCFTPWIIEFILKARSGFKARSLGDLQKDGTLKAPYEKIYSMTHIPMKLFKITEEKATLFLIGIQIIVCLTSFFLSILKII